MKATGFKFLRINRWNITQVILIRKIFSSTLTSYYIQSYLLKRYMCYASAADVFLRMYKFFKTAEAATRGVLKNFAMFTRKHLCWSLFGVFGVNFIKKSL